MATLPVVVVVGIRAGKVASRAGLRVERNGLTLGARVVGTANSDILRELVLNKNSDCVGAGHAQALRHIRVRQVQLAALAKNATNRLASGALRGRPLGLLVASWAGV